MRPSLLSLVSLLVAVLALLATWWQGLIARDAEKRSLRAYATSDGLQVHAVPNPAGIGIAAMKILANWANHGGTPTRKAIVTTQCLSCRPMARHIR
jgi:hypothetical protein